MQQAARVITVMWKKKIPINTNKLTKVKLTMTMYWEYIVLYIKFLIPKETTVHKNSSFFNYFCANHTQI